MSMFYLNYTSINHGNPHQAFLQVDHYPCSYILCILPPILNNKIAFTTVG